MKSNNDDMFRSLSSMAEEYDRLVSPLTNQLGIFKRWNEIPSPVLRVAELHDNVFKGMMAFNSSLARQLSLMTAPYKPVLNNIAAIENLMETPFATLVRPQIYVPDISASLSSLESSFAKLGKEARIAHTVSTVANVAKLSQQNAQLLKPWLIDLGVISSFDTTIKDSAFSRLVGMEKVVANLSDVKSKYSQITSISAQIASLQQLGLTDAWKKAITPPELLSGLNDFAIKQYELIQKATDDQSIKWRLGLISAASKFVDSQVTWGSSLAIDIDEDAPETVIAIPDFSDLPIFLGPAKRDDKDVEEAFDESQVIEITNAGKLIVQKAKVANDFCKVRNMPALFPYADLLKWAMTLSGAFCRDSEKLDDVMETLKEMFIRKPVIELIGRHSCFKYIEANRGSKETKKKQITSIQQKIYSQIIDAEDALIEALNGVSISFLNEDTVSSNVMKALINLQKDKMYEGAKENSINDGIRNQLSLVYEVKDQTRQGDSESGKDAGEVDIMLCDNGNPAVILEGLRMDSFNQNYLDIHINKTLSNYDPNGCSQVYILIYATVKRFGEFWDKVINHMEGYSFPYETVEKMRDVTTAYTDSRHAKAVLNRNGKSVSVHLYAVAMR